jgi:hypothetical protein
MEKLIEIQNELKVPKGNINKFGNYKYRSAEDILEAVKPILLKHRGYLLLTDRVTQVGEKLFVQATASLYFKGEKIEGLPMFFEAQGYAELSEHKGMSSEQATGTASSYARKYALNGLFLIDETEADADNENVKKAPNKELIEAENKLKACSTLSSLQNVYMDLSIEMRKLTLKLKDELKTTLPA